MKLKTKICKYCGACKIIYRMFCGVIKTHDYYCVEHDKLTTFDDVCDLWRRKEKRRYDLSAERFNKAEDDLKAIFTLTNLE